MKIILCAVANLLFVHAILTAQVLESIKARDALTDVIAKAKSEFSQDAELRMVIFAGVDQSGFQLKMDPQTGKASAWFYDFYSPNLDKSSFYLATKIPMLGLLIQSVPDDTIGTLPGLDQLPPLGTSWIDSDVALQGSMNGGGAAFFQTHADARIALAALVYNPTQIPIPPVPPGPIWTFNFVSSTDSLTCIVNGTTGVSIFCGLPTGVPPLTKENAFELEQNFPNPVGLGDHSVTTIRFRISENALPVNGSRRISMRLYDALGRVVETLANGDFDPGSYSISLDVSQLRSGVYYYRLSTEKSSKTRRFVVTR